MNKRSVDDNFTRQVCVYGSGCYQKSVEHLKEFSHPGEAPEMGAPQPPMPVAAPGTPGWSTTGQDLMLRGSAENPAGLYGFQGMMGDYPVGFEDQEALREPTPPPVVERLPGYLEEPVTGLKEVDKLVYGHGAKRDAGGVLGMGLPKLSSDQALVVQRAKKYAMEVSIKMVLMKQTLAHQQQQTKYLQRQQAVAIMSRIYVGCINYDTREDAIKQAFVTFGPIRSITMSWDSMTGKHKGFAFVEFEQPEAAQLALDQMNGILVCGRNIKVGRPSQMPQAQACIDEIQKEARNYNRIYVASIHKDLHDDDIRSVFSAFGPIKACELASAGIPGRHKGYGYIEYETTQSTQEAISSMNLFDLGGQFLRVGRAITPPETRSNALAGTLPQAMPSASAVAAAAATAKIQAMDAVATNMGVDAAALSMPTNNPLTQSNNQSGDWRDRTIRKCGLPRDEQGRPIKANANMPHAGPRKIPGVTDSPPRAERSLDRRRSRSPRDSRGRDSRGRSKTSRDRSPRKSRDRSRESSKKREEVPTAAVPPPTIMQAPLQLGGLPTPPTIPASSFQAPAKAGMEGVQEKAMQLEMDKKLQDEGEPVTLKQQEDMQIRGKSARQMVMQKLMGARGKVDSVVLLLKNMVGSDEVDEDLHDEIQAECGKYGKVENVVIYQEKQDDSEDAEIHVKIFVEFQESLDTKKAKNALDGRFFGGRTVSALIYDQEMYDQQDFSA